MTPPLAIALHGNQHSHAGPPDLEPLDPAAGPATIARCLDRADMLVVPDALAFPFDALAGHDQDIPLVMGLPTALDATDVEAALGPHRLDHLTALDTVVGPGTTVQALTASRFLPTSCQVLTDVPPGGPIDDPVACAIARQRELVHRWERVAAPTDATSPYELAWVPDPVDLRAIKARLRLEQQVLRESLRGVGLQRPPVIQRAAIVAGRPETVAPALSGSSATWHGAALGPAPDLPADLDAVILVGDVLHHPPEDVESLLDHCLAALRVDGWMLLLSAVVPDPREVSTDRPVPRGAGSIQAMLQGRARMVDVRGVRRPGEDHHRVGLFVFAAVG